MEFSILVSSCSWVSFPPLLAALFLAFNGLVLFLRFAIQYYCLIGYKSFFGFAKIVLFVNR